MKKFALAIFFSTGLMLCFSTSTLHASAFGQLLQMSGGSTTNISMPTPVPSKPQPVYQNNTYNNSNNNRRSHTNNYKVKRKRKRSHRKHRKHTRKSTRTKTVKEKIYSWPKGLPQKRDWESTNKLRAKKVDFYASAIPENKIATELIDSKFKIRAIRKSKELDYLKNKEIEKLEKKNMQLWLKGLKSKSLPDSVKLKLKQLIGTQNFDKYHLPSEFTSNKFYKLDDMYNKHPKIIVNPIQNFVKKTID